ncbi:hypothetical protein OIU77_030556 [Salix suchowensis]|uniref:C3H1-type domain-containing protein n=1 Tax=Salix suchowensis TaxID=1278906 RepID=A0ABQ9BCE0_9ROSI|nr:hypothetical protein OIU77_030556 [Salix suchowensis]
MEEAPLFTFSLPRKSLLKSQTSRTLVRILSHPLLCQFVPPPPGDGGGGRPHELGNQACSGHVELCHESLLDKNGQERGFSDTQAVINEENVELVCHDSSGPVANWNGNAAGDVAVSNNQDEHFERHPNAIKECRGVGQLQLDEETLCQNKKISSEVSKPVDNCEESSLSRTNGLEVNNEIQQKEIQPDKSVCADASMGYPPHMIEDGEIEEREVSGQFEVDDGSFNMFSEVAVVPQEKKVDEKQASEAIIDKNRLPIIEKNEANKKDSWFSSLMADTVENAKDRREVEAQQRFSSEMACKRKVVTYEDPILVEEGVWCKKQKKCHGVREQNEGSAAKDQNRVSRVKEQKKGNAANDGAGCPVVCPNNLALFTENSDQTASANQGIASKEKDAGLCSKKKRGPPSKEKKAKKKGKERKKRAEKNRQLGVKRLKLLPVLNLKPKSHCRHFLKGRCREGQKCKFSHDAIPLTKFEPCHHFARHKCMKGDNCPYDHQLSKYTCTNYASKGYCIRGESCMFSHKVPLQEDLSSISNISNVCTPKVKPPFLPSTSNSKRQPDISGTSNQTAKALPDSSGVISDDRHAALNVAKTAQNLPAPVPKGFSFLSGGKKSMVESSPKPSSPSLKSNVFIKVGNQIDQCASVTVQNCNEFPRKTPSVVAPKGINFLSFGKAPLDKCSSIMKLKSLAINRGNGVHLFSSKSFTVQEEASSSSNQDNRVLAGKGSQQSVSNVAHGLNKMLQKTESKAFQDASTHSLRRNPQAVHASVQSKIASNKHIESSATQERLSASPLGSGQSSDQLALGCLKNKPLSTQKALMSTLAFAAKIESVMKMNQSTSGALAVSSMVSKQNRDSTTPRGLQIDSEKASKLLEFLSARLSRCKPLSGGKFVSQVNIDGCVLKVLEAKDFSLFLTFCHVFLGSTHSNEWAGNKLDGFSGWHHSLCFAALASVWRRTGACEIVGNRRGLVRNLNYEIVYKIKNIILVIVNLCGR